MSNLSKLKRDELMAFIELLKEKNNDDESVRRLNEIANALTEKKYGLVWEKHTEKVDEMLRHNIPVFEEVEERKIKADDSNDYNFLLEGDNLHSLKLLEKTHRGKIDVIYIDPPYNTGNKDFIYNDSYVDKTDGYSHSKWLSFMNERLEIAKNLLSDEGVIFISIDDNEQAQLKLLCDEVFGENNFISSVPRVTKKSGKNHGRHIAKNHDFILIYSKTDKATIEGIPMEDEEYKLKDEFYEKRGGYKLNQTLDYNSLWYNTTMDFEIEIDGRKFYPGGHYEDYLKRHRGQHSPKDWVWRWSKAKFDFGLKNGFVVVKKGKNGVRIYTKTYCKANIENDNGEYYIQYIDRIKKCSSLQFVENEFSNDNAKKEISKVLKSSNDFDFAKPTSLIRFLINIVGNKNTTILDFFAGSGTTGHAVMQLNKEDGGNRKYILCTNNENNICEEVTYQRLKNIQEDLPHNLKYYKTDFIPKLQDDENVLSDRLLDHIKEMVELENACEIDGVNRNIMLTQEELEEYASNEIKENTTIYIPHYLLLSRELEERIKKKNVRIVDIPDYYFIDELREGGER